MDLGRSTLKLLVAKIGNAVLMFGAITYFVRVLTPEAVSTFFLYLALLGVFSIPADLGVRGALEKRLSEGEQPGRTLGSALAFKAVTLTTVAGAVVLLRPVIDDALGMPFGTLLVVGLVVQELSRFYLHAVRGELRVGETAPLEFARRLVWVSVSVALLNAGWGPRGILVGHICGRTLEMCWGIYRSQTVIGRPSMERLRSLFAFSKYQTITTIGGRVYQWMDVLIIGYLLSGRFVSAYEVAWQVTLLVLLLSKSIELNLFPQVSSWDAEASTARIESAITSALGFVLFISVPALVGAAIYAEAVLSTFFGEEYVIATTVLVILMGEKLVQSYNDIVGTTVRALDRPDLTARATVAAVCVNLVLSPLLILGIGFEGAAIATLLAWLVNASMHTRYVASYLRIGYPTRLVVWYGVASLGMAVVLLAVRALVPVDGVAVLLTQVALGICVYLGVSVAIPTVRNRILWPGYNIIRG